MDRHLQVLRGAGCRDVTSFVVDVVRFNWHREEKVPVKMVLELSFPKPGEHVLPPQINWAKDGPRVSWASSKGYGKLVNQLLREYLGPYEPCIY